MLSEKSVAKFPSLEDDEKNKIVKKLLSYLESPGNTGSRPMLKNQLKNAKLLNNPKQLANLFNAINFFDNANIEIVAPPSELPDPIKIAHRTLKFKNLSDEKEFIEMSLAENSKKELKTINIQGITISLHNGCFFIQEASNQMFACVNKQSFFIQDDQFYLIDRTRYTITPSFNSVHIKYQKYTENDHNSSGFEQIHNSWSIRYIEANENLANKKQPTWELINYSDTCKIFRFLHTKFTFNVCESFPLMLTHGMKIKIGSELLIIDISS